MSLSRIAVDLTPLLPGGENGGAKLLSMETVRALSRLLPECQFLLLTSSRSHDELACLDAPNVHRRCAHSPVVMAGPAAVSGQGKRRLRMPSLAEMVAFVPPSVRVAIPPSVRVAIKSWLQPVRRIDAVPTGGFVREFGADLLFCPFTMPFYHDPGIPTVSVIYDLQYLFYPQFFDEEDLGTRARNFSEACRLSTRLVCISEFVRKTVLENSSLPPEQVVTIPIRLAGRLPISQDERRRSVLEAHRLRENSYFFYPANFWTHKNHRMLLTAYGMYRSRHPRSPLKLVCTGSADDRMRTVREAVSQMRLEQWVCLPGFLSEMEFSALFASCYALVFPSLYEGFGMPVLEAMTMGKPVLCSNVTSLPEVAGDAALYFSPRKPEELLGAMERLTEDGSLVNQLIVKGKAHSPAYKDSERMAEEYLTVFRDASR
jgi:glycosyltransferase involved in cell wall biosynthesis